MPNNPTHPEPPIAQPGQQRPLQEIEDPGHTHPERGADPDPLSDPLERDDDLMPPPPL